MPDDNWPRKSQFGRSCHTESAASSSSMKQNEEEWIQFDMFRQMLEHSARLNGKLVQLKAAYTKEREQKAEEQKQNRAIIKAFQKEKVALEEQNRIATEAYLKEKAIMEELNKSTIEAY